MRNLLAEIYLAYCDRGLLEMTNLRTKHSGLHPVIHISGKGSAKHGPRVKVSNIAGTFSHKDNFSVTTEGRVIGNSKIHPNHLADVIDWVKLNKDHIHNVWHNYGIMDPEDVLNGFKKIG